MDQRIDSLVDVWGRTYTKKRRIWNGGAGPRKRNAFGRDRKIRFSGASWSKRVREERRDEGVVRLLVDVWWHLLPRAGDCAGGRKVVPEVTLCWQSPRIRFLFRRWPATGWRAWWNRLSFLGKCSSAACLGRPVQVCDRHVIAIESRRFDNSVTMDANGGIHRPVKNESRFARARVWLLQILFPSIRIRLLFTNLYLWTRVFLAMCRVSLKNIIIDKLESGFFYKDMLLTGTWLTDFDDWILLWRFESVICCAFQTLIIINQYLIIKLIKIKINNYVKRSKSNFTSVKQQNICLYLDGNNLLKHFKIVSC